MESKFCTVCKHPKNEKPMKKLIVLFSIDANESSRNEINNPITWVDNFSGQSNTKTDIRRLTSPPHFLPTPPSFLLPAALWPAHQSVLVWLLSLAAPPVHHPLVHLCPQRAVAQADQGGGLEGGCVCVCECGIIPCSLIPRLVWAWDCTVWG